jgi:hypothetical protein
MRLQLLFMTYGKHNLALPVKELSMHVCTSGHPAEATIMNHFKSSRHYVQQATTEKKRAAGVNRRPRTISAQQNG